ncbi:phospholipase D family protein [Marinobacter salinexigens]|uniref:Phospholipase D family protein n=1 Tax=Marinobacter salinexigens TaxID=2919747 RepID=A0A5B0VKH9_9GAMM|nr:phospholipase D family protein [Marinobacter salinexigens]
MFVRRSVVSLAVFVAFLAVTGCALPALSDRTESYAIPPAQTSDTRIGRAIAEKVISNPGLSGVHPLANPHDAFAARALLAEAADVSMDVQYYIWRDDITGTMLLHSLYRAAERGVRVRLLLDDNGIAGLDQVLAALDRHQSIEVRLFNPFVLRSPKVLGYLTDFRRLNHRMHNKSFTVDNQAAIIGGRNIADEYFGAGQGALFADLDVLTIGSAVEQVSADFDRYWASSSSYPAADILSEPGEQDLQQWLESARSLESTDEALQYVRTLEGSRFLKDLLAGELDYVWAPVDMVSDDPAKALGQAEKDQLLSQQLRKALGDPKRSVTLVSPYFIPTDAGVELFRSLEERGVEVRVLTNSLEANDVAMVHAGYAKYREPLLEAGVEMYELRRIPGNDSAEKTLQSGLRGSSSASLHAKTFAVDGETVFVGSFNFDPRSNHINTELGFVIESAELAQALESVFDEQVKQGAYQVQLDDDGEMAWIAHNGDETERYEHDPGTGPLKRMLVFLFSLLPIESLL